MDKVTLHINISSTDGDAEQFAQSIMALIQETQVEVLQHAGADFAVGGGTEGKEWWITQPRDWADHVVIDGRDAEYVCIMIGDDADGVPNRYVHVGDDDTADYRPVQFDEQEV